MNKFYRIVIILIILCISTTILSYFHNFFLNLDTLQIENATKTLTKSQLVKKIDMIALFSKKQAL